MLDDDEDDPIRYASNEECTMELRTSVGTQIRLVFYSMVDQLRTDYDQDYPTKSACLRIRDVTFDASLTDLPANDTPLFRKLKRECTTARV